MEDPKKSGAPEVNSIVLPQDQETAVTFVEHNRLFYRYGYVRSRDARESGEKGADFLAIKEDGQRLALAVCDGVMNSFYGDVAAKFLGQKLIDYLWGLDVQDNTQKLRDSLQDQLNNWSVECSSLVNSIEIPETVSPMVRTALELIRESRGSQTTFCGVLINLEKKQALSIHLGDTFIGINDGVEWISVSSDANFHDTWSTQNPSSNHIDVKLYTRLPAAFVVSTNGLLCSDIHDAQIFDTCLLPTEILNKILSYSKGTDDVSFIQVWLQRKPTFKIPEPRNLRIAEEGRNIIVEWDHAYGEVSYQIAISNSNQEIRSSRYTIPQAEITKATHIQVRTMAMGRSSDWSNPQYLLPPPKITDVVIDADNTICSNVQSLGVNGIDIKILFKEGAEIIGNLFLEDQTPQKIPFNIAFGLTSAKMRFVAHNAFGLWSESLLLRQPPSTNALVFESEDVNSVALGGLAGNSEIEVAFLNSNNDVIHNILLTQASSSREISSTLLDKSIQFRIRHIEKNALAVWSKKLTLLPPPYIYDFLFTADDVFVTKSVYSLPKVQGVEIFFERDGELVERLLLTKTSSLQKVSRGTLDQPTQCKIRYVGADVQGLWTKKTTLLPPPRIEDITIQGSVIRINKHFANADTVSIRFKSDGQGHHELILSDPEWEGKIPPDVFGSNDTISLRMERHGTIGIWSRDFHKSEFPKIDLGKYDLENKINHSHDSVAYPNTASDNSNYDTEEKSSKTDIWDNSPTKSQKEKTARNKNFDISVACPGRIEMGRSSLFLIQFYLPALRAQVKEMLAQKYKKGVVEHLVTTERLKLKQRISVELLSSELNFTLLTSKDGNAIRLSDRIDVKFLGSPSEHCRTGKQQVLLVVRDAKTGDVLVNENFEVRVVDYAFGRVHRSWVNLASSILLGIGSLVMFLLTVLEQIDKSFGFASGTAGLFVVGILLTRFLALYQLPRQAKNITQ